MWTLRDISGLILALFVVTRMVMVWWSARESPLLELLEKRFWFGLRWRRLSGHQRTQARASEAQYLCVVKP
jgi:hypothetical protein